MLGPTGTAGPDGVTDGNGEATWTFMTSTDPGDPAGTEQRQQVTMLVTVSRPEVAEAKAKLNEALFGGIPGILRPYVAALFAPYIDGLETRLNAILDAHGSGTATLFYHDPVKPRPSPLPSASGLCSPSPMLAGSYTGTNESTETIDSPPSMTHAVTSGPVQLQVTADGSVTGTWGYTLQFVYDANVAGVNHHHESTMVMSGGTISGTACALVINSGTVHTTRCVDSLVGDCLATSHTSRHRAGASPSGLRPRPAASTRGPRGTTTRRTG